MGIVSGLGAFNRLTVDQLEDRRSTVAVPPVQLPVHRKFENLDST